MLREKQFLKHAIIGMIILMTSAGAHAQSQPTSGTVKFKVIPGTASGLKKIIQDWHDEELKRQGGKFQSHGWWLWGLTSLDIDNDGDMDLVPTHHGLPGGLILKNQLKETGKLTFTNFGKTLGIDSRTLPQGIGFKTSALDIDGDGWLDLVGIRSPNFRNEKGKHFTPYGNKGFSTSHPLSIEDVNGDGYPDIVDRQHFHLADPEKVDFKTQPRSFDSLNARVPEALMKKVLERKKATRFWTYEYHTQDDLNGDGIDDVVVSGVAGYSKQPLAYYLLADKGGNLSDATEASGLPVDAKPILFADLNGDGFVDILATENKTKGGLYLNDGKGKFSLKPGPLTDFVRRVGPYADRAWPVDFDCDGDLDLVVSNPRYGQERIFENKGGGNFTVVHVATGWDSDPVAICDVDGDGRMDVVIGSRPNDITIYLNQSEVANFCNLYPRMAKPNWTAAGAVVEIFKAGDLSKPGARPFKREKAHGDATAIHIGLGQATNFDLRVTFPDKKKSVVEVKGVEAKRRIKVTPDGKLSETDVGAYPTEERKGR